MTTVLWIAGVSVAGGGLSVLAAAVFTAFMRSGWIEHLVSYAVGALLGAAFLEVLPHAIERSESPQYAASLVLAGILFFFMLEKMVLWRHCHDDACAGHGRRGADGGRSGALVMLGDSIHNLVDGVLIGAAFMDSLQLGMITAAAMVAHEIPQEVGDFVILLHSGYSKRRALTLNLLSSLMTLLGGIFACLALPHVQDTIPILLALACSSMIYVAVADLIPGLHRKTEAGTSILQVVLISLGILSIASSHHLIERFGLGG